MWVPSDTAAIRAKTNHKGPAAAATSSQYLLATRGACALPRFVSEGVSRLFYELHHFKRVKFRTKGRS